MKKYMAILVCLIFSMTMASLAHDPRTVAKEMGVSLSIEGSGDLEIHYKSLAFNTESYGRMKAGADFRNSMNKGIWNRIGKAQLGFELIVGGETLTPGDYEFGLNIEANDAFSLVFSKGDLVKTIPTKVVTADNISHLTLSLIPTNSPDTFLLEGRCGTFRATAEVKIPYLEDDHDPHPAEN